MSVIIRLQNLPWSANALDIRQYFQGLSIPEGGVHIVGGELGDAFIAFSTDEDARQAFNMNCGKIKEVQIKLMLSSRTEMQKVIEAARTQSLAAFSNNVVVSQQAAPPPPATQLQTPVQNLLSQMSQSLQPPQVPEIPSSTVKREDSSSSSVRGDRRRSRSRSRDRRDRRDSKRDRRDRRSRSRSRDRRDRRGGRRDRSRSRDRSNKSSEKAKDRANRRSGGDKTSSVASRSIGVWEPPAPASVVPDNILQNPAALSLLGSLLPNAGLLQNLEASSNPFSDRWQPPNVDFPTTIAEIVDPAASHQYLFGNNLLGNNYNMQSTENTNNSPAEHQTDNHFRNNDSRQFDELSNNSKQRESDECNNCIRLQPYYGGFGEIRRFFNGIFIHNTGIKFAMNKFGQQTGVVLIRFAYSQGKAQALERNGSLLKNQYAQVIHLEDEHFENGIDPQAVADDIVHGPFTCLVVEELPPFTTNQHLLKIFSDYAVLNMYIVNQPRCPPIGYVKFGSSDNAQKALSDSVKHVVEGKRVLVGPCRDEIFENVQRDQEGILNEPSPKQSAQNSNKSKESDGATNCLYLLGLPHKTTDRDVSDFFSDIGIVPEKIHMLTNEHGFKGQVYCEFFNVDEARVAYQKKGMPLGSGIVGMSYITKQYIYERVPSQRDNGDSNEGHQQNFNDHHARMPLGDNMNHNNGPGPFGNMNMHNNGPPFGNMMHNNMPRPPFFPRGNFNGGPRGPPRHPGMMRGPPGMRNIPPQPPMHMRRFPRPPQFNQQDGPHDEEHLAPPGCTMLMENVPFSAELDEILQFFDGYDVQPDNVLRKYDPMGRPSGETKVIFTNPDEVFHIIQEKRGHKIRDRCVFLSQC